MKEKKPKATAKILISETLWNELSKVQDNSLDVVQRSMSRWNLKDITVELLPSYVKDDTTYWVVEDK